MKTNYGAVLVRDAVKRAGEIKSLMECESLPSAASKVSIRARVPWVQLERDMKTFDLVEKLGSGIKRALCSEKFGATVSDLEELSRLPYEMQFDVVAMAREAKFDIKAVLHGTEPRTTYKAKEADPFEYARKRLQAAVKSFDDLPNSDTWCKGLYSDAFSRLGELIKILEEWEKQS